MVNLPISDYVKNYYQGRNIVLDDFTQAAIIASQRPEWMGWSKRLSMLQDIADNTADECLKLQIEDHINYRLRQKSRFMDNQGGRYFYYCSGYWTTIDKAIECGKQSGDSKISIIKFDTSKYEVMPSEAAMAGEAIWDTDGNTVLQLFSYTAIEEYPKDTHGRKTRFDLETIIPCVFPFARGDVVKSIRTGRTGVLLASRTDWERQLQSMETEEYPSNVHGNEVVVRTASSSEGYFYDSYEYLLDLEKIAEVASIEDKDILRCASRTLQENIADSDEMLRKVGLWFYTGDGVPQNNEEAFKWLRKAAGSHDNESRYWVGRLYAEGCGVPQSFAKALNWYLAAARHGHTEAQFEVGRYFEDGIGVPPKHKKAVEWFQKAADQGHVEARRRLSDTVCTE